LDGAADKIRPPGPGLRIEQFGLSTSLIWMFRIQERFSERFSCEIRAAVQARIGDHVQTRKNSS
jgi:hypothetical protein